MSRAIAGLAGSSLASRLLAALPLLPWMSKFYLLLAFDALLFGAVAMSLDLLMGYTGLVSFGHAAFFGLGAYSTAVLLERGVTLALARAWASPLARGRALRAGRRATSPPARRGIYFALLTLIFAEVVYTFFRYTQTFGGSDGIQGLPPPDRGPGRRHRHAAPELLPGRRSTWPSPTSPAACSSPRTSARCWSPSGRTRTARASSATTSSATRWPCA